jgi:hypothetical protein
MGVGEIAETPELLAAIDEADAAPEEEDVTADDLRRKVKRWARDNASRRLASPLAGG